MSNDLDEPPALHEIDISRVGALLADPARAAMLMALCGNTALPATELAARAGISASTASIHLTKLMEAGWLTVEQYGRHRYYRLASPQVTALLGQTMSVASLCHTSHSKPEQEQHRQSQQASHDELRHARTCYDHLAGELGVALTEALVRQHILSVEEKDYVLTEQGKTRLEAWGVNVNAANGQRRAFARRCLDWTERRDHLGGALGATICSTWLERGWVQRQEGSRALLIMPDRVEQLKAWGVAWPVSTESAASNHAETSL